jgi:tetratricopeptide (TPR) repeat protein
MRPAIIVIALLAACGGGRKSRVEKHDDQPTGRSAVPSTSLVPSLPPSEDPARALSRIDGEVALYVERDNLPNAIGALLTRTEVRGRLEDYQQALALSERYVKEAKGPSVTDAWRARTRVLTRVHRFADARAALEYVKKGSLNETEWRDLAAAIDEASGHLDKSAPVRETIATEWGSPTNLVALAGSLSLQGKLDEALAVMPKAAANVRDNSPQLLAYLLFQWGRLYELKGEPASAKELFAAARARLPTLENTVHLAQAMVATGDTDGARKVVADELATNRHPDVLALAGQLEKDQALTDEARREWDRYVAALPEAFSDHAARFYLKVDPAHALELAKANLKNRDTLEARELAVGAAIEAKQPKVACELVGALVGSPIRAQKFTAWRAATACGHTADADRLAGELGITR